MPGAEASSGRETRRSRKPRSGFFSTILGGSKTDESTHESPHDARVRPGHQPRDPAPLWLRVRSLVTRVPTEGLAERCDLGRTVLAASVCVCASAVLCVDGVTESHVHEMT